MAAYIRNILWFFILFIGFEALGLREQGASGLGNQSAGFYGVLQIVFLLILILSPVIYITYASRIRLSGHLSIAIHLIFILFLVELVLNIFMGGGYPLSKLLYNFYSLKYYLIFFFISLWYKDLESLDQLFKGVMVAAVISSVIFLVFAFVYEFPSVIKKLTSSQAERELRYLVPMGMLMAFGLCYEISIIIHKGLTPGRVIIALLLFTGVFMQLHRNVHLSLIIVFAAVGNKIFLIRQKVWIRMVAYGVIGSITGWLIQNLLANSESIVAQSIEEAKSDGGGIGIRIAVLANSLKYVMEHAPVLGIGFLWQDFDIYTILEDLFVLAPTNDNAYTNVLLCFGIAGVVIYTYLIIAMFKSLNKLKKIPNVDVQIMRYTIQLSLIYILVSGFGTDNFIAYNSVIVFVILTAVLNKLNYFVHDRHA